MNARQFLIDLLYPSVYPKVPKIVRESSRAALKHFPHEYELEELRKACPEILGKCPDSSIGTKNTKKVRKLKEEGTLKMVWEDE
jgi:hypothetical protein